MTDPSANRQVDDPRRRFAESVVSRLVDAGFQALWAGGCVRDSLLGRTPKDYDVATSATPEQVIELFGKRHTVPVGVSFGVVMVLSHDKATGEVEVATFRSDGQYLDGRRPESVRFCSPEEDARRRDFTINGMFYDPLTETLHDFVGGQQDLDRKVIRAIGDANERFEEDKLRMLRAIRFASTYHFELESKTQQAILDRHQQLRQVSQERITAEIRRMLAESSRPRSFSLLIRTRLHETLFPDQMELLQESWVNQALSHLTIDDFQPSFAVLLRGQVVDQASDVQEMRRQVLKTGHRWKMSNSESDCIAWLLQQERSCRGQRSLPLHVAKPILSDQRHLLFVDFLKACELADGRSTELSDWLLCLKNRCSEQELHPPTLVTGHQLMEAGVSPGPRLAELLKAVRNAQLDEQIGTRDEAMALVSQLREQEA